MWEILHFFYHNNIILQVHTNYKLHKMEKAKKRLKKTQNLLKVTCRLE